ELWVDVYGYDYPRRPWWPYWFLGAELPEAQPQMQAFAAQALAFSIDDLSALEQLPPAQRETIAAAFGQRFMGHPQRAGDSLERELNTTSSANRRREILEQLVKGDPTKYLGLGNSILATGGKFEDAQAAFLAYPSFRSGQAHDN